jgi:hypothetical protein
MRGYSDHYERLRHFLPEGKDPTDAEILEAMADEQAYKLDMARDRMKEEHLFDIPAMTSEEIDKRLNHG